MPGKTQDSHKTSNILVLGGSSGIGLGIAKDLMQQGFAVFIMDRNDPPEEERALIGGFFQFDLSTIGTVDRLTGLIDARLKFDHLVITAGGTQQQEVQSLKEGKPFWSLGDQAIEATVRLNLTCQILFVNRFLPLFTDAPANRSITLTSSVNSLGRYGLTVYSASKAGLEGFTRAAAEDLGRIGVRINCVLPGSVKTAASIRENMNFEVAAKQSLLNRMNEPEDIAEVVSLFVNSNAITGQCYVCDSGQSLKSMSGRY
jgi:3-oxoacyl-[acyl-carrier protein] reductase